MCRNLHYFVLKCVISLVWGHHAQWVGRVMTSCSHASPCSSLGSNYRTLSSFYILAKQYNQSTLTITVFWLIFEIFTVGRRSRKLWVQFASRFLFSFGCSFDISCWSLGTFSLIDVFYITFSKLTISKVYSRRLWSQQLCHKKSSKKQKLCYWARRRLNANESIAMRKRPFVKDKKPVHLNLSASSPLLRVFIVGVELVL